MFIAYFRYLNIIVPLVALAFGFYAFKSLGKELRVLFCFVCFAAFSEIVAVLISMKDINNMPEAHVYVVVEFILLTLFYAGHLKKYINRKYIWGIIVVFASGSILNGLFFQGITVYPSISRAVESIIMVGFASLYFHKVMIEAKINKLLAAPMIWINTAILVYFSGNFFFHTLLPVLLRYSFDFAKQTVLFFWLLNFLFYVALSVAFFKQKKWNT